MLSVAILTTGTLFAQSATPTPPSGSMPAGDQTGMMDMASPAADAAPRAMTMEQCMAMMMDMMMGMMGDGEMSDMMATPGAGMDGMMATPGAGMDGMMAMTMEQCMAMMMDMMMGMMGDGEMSDMMATPASGT